MVYTFLLNSLIILVSFLQSFTEFSFIFTCEFKLAYWYWYFHICYEPYLYSLWYTSLSISWKFRSFKPNKPSNLKNPNKSKSYLQSSVSWNLGSLLLLFFHYLLFKSLFQVLQITKISISLNNTCANWN